MGPFYHLIFHISTRVLYFILIDFYNHHNSHVHDVLLIYFIHIKYQTKYVLPFF